jgi:hypothetical protein
MHIGVLWESQNERDHYEDQDVGGWTIQRVHKVREHFKLFIAQELQIIQTSYTCHFEEKL